MRYPCEEPGFEGNWIEVDLAWTRAEWRAFWSTETDRDATLALIQSKVTTCNLERIGQPPLTIGSELTEEALDQVDIRLYMWFTSVTLRAAQDINNAGEALRRKLFAISETTIPAA